MQKLTLNGESIDRRGMVGIPVSQQFYVTLKFHQVSPDTNGHRRKKKNLGDLMLIPWNPPAVFPDRFVMVCLKIFDAPQKMHV